MKTAALACQGIGKKIQINNVGENSKLKLFCRAAAPAAAREETAASEPLPTGASASDDHRPEQLAAMHNAVTNIDRPKNMTMSDTKKKKLGGKL